MIIFAATIGAILGSFSVAQVWRERARQLVDDKKAGEKIDADEFRRLKPLADRSVMRDRSQCLSCGHSLGKLDLIPILSWLFLGGKCRYCKAKIGATEFVTEAIMAAIFATIIAFWPWQINNFLEIVRLIAFMVGLVALCINFIYDMKWSLLIAKYNWLLIFCGLIVSSIAMLQVPELATLTSVMGSVAILGGLYGLLWLISRGAWVGNGDIYLGTGLALLLADWSLAIVALFMANLVGTLIILPQLLSKKLSRGSHVPFGPLLIVGFLLAWFFGRALINLYFGSILFV